MFNLKKHGIILEKTDLPFENQAVLNPATIRVKDDVHMFYRAVKKRELFKYWIRKTKRTFRSS